MMTDTRIKLPIDPAILQKYEDALPGARESILRLYEEERRHIREMNARRFAAHEEKQKWTKWMGLAVAISGLALAGLAAALGSGFVAALFGAMSGASLTAHIRQK